MSTLAKMVMGLCLVGIGLVAASLAVKYVWDLGIVGIVILAIVAVAAILSFASKSKGKSGL